MIVTCENCHTRYLVPNHAIGGGGRHVRCTVCGTDWYQSPDGADSEGRPSFKDELVMAGESFAGPPEGVEPIPDSVKPIPEGSALPALSDGKARKALKLSVPKGALSGFASAAVFILLIGGAAALLRTHVAAAWPPATALYDTLGMDIALPGEGLVFDRLTAVRGNDADGAPVVTVEGRIINLRSEAVTVPKLYAAVRDEQGAVIGEWTFATDTATLDAQAEVNISSVYKGAPAGAHDVSISMGAGH